MTAEQKERRVQINKLRSRKAVGAEVLEKHSQHQKKHGRSREPLLSGVTTEYDLKLFREAQARACEEIVSISHVSNGFFTVSLFNYVTEI